MAQRQQTAVSTDRFCSPLLFRAIFSVFRSYHCNTARDGCGKYRETDRGPYMGSERLRIDVITGCPYTEENEGKTDALPAIDYDTGVHRWESYAEQSSGARAFVTCL